MGQFFKHVFEACARGEFLLWFCKKLKMKNNSHFYFLSFDYNVGYKPICPFWGPKKIVFWIKRREFANFWKKTLFLVNLHLFEGMLKTLIEYETARYVKVHNPVLGIVLRSVIILLNIIHYNLLPALHNCYLGSARPPSLSTLWSTPRSMQL